MTITISAFTSMIMDQGVLLMIQLCNILMNPGSRITNSLV